MNFEAIDVKKYFRHIGGMNSQLDAYREMLVVDVSFKDEIGVGSNDHHDL